MTVTMSTQGNKAQVKSPKQCGGHLGYLCCHSYSYPTYRSVHCSHLSPWGGTWKSRHQRHSMAHSLGHWLQGVPWTLPASTQASFTPLQVSNIRLTTQPCKIHEKQKHSGSHSRSGSPAGSGAHWTLMKSATEVKGSVKSGGGGEMRLCVYACLCTCVCACMYMSVYICVCACVSMHVCVFVHVYACS